MTFGAIIKKGAKRSLGKPFRCFFFSLIVGLLSLGASSGVEKERIEVTVREGTNMAAAVSPDGRNIVIDLQGRLWVLPVSGGTAKAFTGELDEARQPAWSPDGAWIAFQAYTDENWHLWMMRPGGTGLRQLTFGLFDDREPSWSPDSARIVFSSDRSGNYDLWAVEVAGEKLQQLTNEPSDDYYPAWSPDGSKIAFVSRRGEKFGLYLKELTGEGKLITSSQESLMVPAWRPDGRQITYTSVGESRSQILAVDLASDSSQPLTNPDEDVFVSRVSWLSEQEFLYTADGKIKRRTLEGSPKTVEFEATFALQRREKYPLKDHKFKSTQPRPVKGILGPAVSPDGKQIAFAALGDLWLLGDKPEPVRLTNDPYLDVDSAWSPDGRSLAYLSDRRGAGVMDLWIREMKTGQERRLTQTDESLRLPSWAPNGGQIAVYMQNSRDWHASILHIVDVQTGQMKKVHESLFLPSQPSWSADEKTIAVSALRTFSDRDRKGANEILLVSLEGKPSRFITPVPTRSLGNRARNNLAWSPNGRQMAYIYDGLLWIVPVNLSGDLIGPPRRLTNELAESPSWTGDSNSLVYLATDRLKKIYLNDGHTEELPLTLNWRPAQPTGRKVVRAGQLFDGKSAEYRRNVDIVIEGNEIKQIVPRRSNWENAEIIDASDKTVVPGLFQMHIHHFTSDGEKIGRIWLSHGITSVREPGADPYEALELKESWASGARLGPREFFGPIFEGSRIYYWINIPTTSDAQIELELNRILRLDYDLIKTYERMPDRLQKRITEFAHRHGILVTSHELYPAASYGVDVVEHLGTADRVGYSDRQTIHGRVYDDVIQLQSKSGMMVVPTAARGPGRGFAYEAAQNPRILDSPQLSIFTPAYREAAKSFLESWASRAPVLSKSIQAQQESIRRLVENGVRISSGTDGGTVTYGYGLIFEIAYLASATNPYQALQAATIRAAQATGVDDQLGSIEPGKLADLVVIDGDPLSNVMDLMKVVTVMKNGQQYGINELLNGKQK